MLSDEEKETVEYFKDDINYLEDALNHPNFLCHFITIRDKEFQMLKILVNLIEKQSKEIEELKEDKYGLEEEVQMQAKNIMLCEEALCEMQDKIKAKIEEVKDGTFDAEIVLQSLLEKE